MAVERSPLDKSGSRRGFGLPIAAWLVLGFAMVIGAFVAASLFALRSTRHATADVTRVQQEFEPLARKAREFGDRAATFDRAVLGYLRTYSEENRQAVADAGVSISDVVNDPSWADAGARTAGFKDAVARLAAHQAEGFSLLDLQDRRNRAADALESTLTSLETRIGTSGARGLRVGENLLTRPSLAELADAAAAMHGELAEQISDRAPSPVVAAPRGVARFRATLARNRESLRVSPGAAWLDLIDEDFARALALRDRIGELDGELTARRALFAASSDRLAAFVHDELEGPAWSELTAAAQDARMSVERAQTTIADATFKAVLLTLLVLTATAWVITWPVRRLTAGTRRLAGGDHTARVRRGGAAEIDELAQAFNHLAVELEKAERAVKNYQAQLEQRVEERTLQLRHLAEHDPLTNLPNRRQLFRHLDSILAVADPALDHLAVLFLDLDNFKTVNDSLGHEFGDRVLTEIGERLRQISGEMGFIARLGGDEFTLVFPFRGSVEEVEQRTAQLVESFQRPLLMDRREISIGVSCGAATFPEHGKDAASLLRAADAALFRAKELGRNRLCIFDPELLVAASNRFRVEQALRKAIDGGDFVLHFQPQVSLSKRRTTAAEALLRWRKSATQIAPAAEFIAIAEQSGLMLDLNEWVLDQAAQAVRRWRDGGWSDARVAINVSAQQFITGDFLGDVERLLARHDLPPDAIELELTENMLQTGAITIESLHRLRRLGVAIVLDDFGTGYSSLTSLEQLPLSQVKLDRSVIAEVDWNPRAAAIASSIIGLCRSLGLQVTVEGVERPSQIDVLIGCGDVSIQGYLVGRPMDSASVLDFVDGTEAHVGALLRAAEALNPVT